VVTGRCPRCHFPGEIEERVICDNAATREICISREIKSTESERYLGVHFLFNGKYSSHRVN
jgi:hypothetical protein